MIHEFQKNYLRCYLVDLKIVHVDLALCAFFFSVGEIKTNFQSDYYSNVHLKLLKRMFE